MKQRLFGLVLATLISTHAAADFNDGVVALMMGEYAKALQTFVPLAETSNHAYAQYFLGRMYAGGQGVEQSYSEAAKWYQKAAEQGVSEAQYRLGNLYKNGEGVPQDAETAYGWYRVAAHLGNSKSAAAVKDVSGLLSAEEMTGAAKLSEELIAKYGKVPKTTSHSE